jgi:alpha-beta hydrolase superfamily lysophospholipase
VHILASLSAIASLLLAVALIFDGIAAIRRWRGLRLATIVPRKAFALATFAATVYLAILWSSTDRPYVFAISLVAFPATLLLLLVRSRNINAQAWRDAGTWDTHHSSAVEIPLTEGHVPALFFEPSERSDAAVVLLHGAGAHKTFYSWPLIDGLLEAGVAVCAIDIDGHGDNERTLDFPAVLENVDASVRWLHARARWVGAVGVSMGGAIAARAVAEGVEVDALALLEAPADAQITRRAVRHERWTIARRATWGLHRYAGTIPLITGWRTAPTRTRIGTIDLIRRLDLPASLSKVRCPCLLIYGSSDLVVPVEQAAMLAAAAPAGTPLIMVQGATHISLPIERQAIVALSDWVRRFVAYGRP